MEILVTAVTVGFHNFRQSGSKDQRDGSAYETITTVECVQATIN